MLVEGRVQGVGFRAFVAAKAKALGLKGFVRNLPDGRVEVVAEGDRDRLDKLAAWVKRGPRRARVSGVQIEPAPIDETFERFFIRRA